MTPDHNPKDDIPFYNEQARRQIESAFRLEYNPNDGPGFWADVFTWVATLVTFPAYVAWCILTRKRDT